MVEPISDISIIVFLGVGLAIFIGTTIYLYTQLNKINTRHNSVVEELNSVIEKAQTDNQRIADDAENIIEDIIQFVLSLYDYMDSPIDNAKLALQVTWEKLPSDVRISLKDIKHLVE